MKRPGRVLSDEEVALWAVVARTVRPIGGKPPADREQALPSPVPAGAVLPKAKPQPSRSASSRPAPYLPPERAGQPLDRHGLDAGWDRRLARGLVAPDFTLDLHGCTLDAAHAGLDHGLTLALAQGARIVLLITGRSRRPDEHAGRGERRGAIRAKFLDWLAAGPHASRIAAIRPAHPRHGGAGAVYIVLRRHRG